MAATTRGVRETGTGDDPGNGARTIEHTLDTAGPLSQVVGASSSKDAVAFLYGLQRIAALGAR